MQAAATALASAIDEVAHRAGLARDNSVSPYRHNLLIAVFYSSSQFVAESARQNNISQFNDLKAYSENMAEHGFSTSPAHRSSPSGEPLGRFLAATGFPPDCNVFNAAKGLSAGSLTSAGGSNRASGFRG